jgi:hypothetical protein
MSVTFPETSLLHSNQEPLPSVPGAAYQAGQGLGRCGPSYLSRHQTDHSKAHLLLAFPEPGRPRLGWLLMLLCPGEIILLPSVKLRCARLDSSQERLKLRVRKAGAVAI